MEKFKPTFQSLHNYKCPDWFRNAKFGIWSHWGPQSVPMYGGAYAKFMYTQGTPQYIYHCRRYGHPSKFGYKDICKLWKAENFDPDKLISLYYKAGARYIVAQAAHYENFFNYSSKLNRFNSMEMGPHKDICGMWQKAAKKIGIPFGLSDHLSRSFNLSVTNKGCDKYGPYKDVPYDTNDPQYFDFYFNSFNEVFDPKRGDKHTKNKEFRKYWFDFIKEIIDLYEPDFLYSDAQLPFGCNDTKMGDEDYKLGLEAVSYLYNKSIDKYGENRAVYTQKDIRKEIASIGVFDIERCHLSDKMDLPWQMDSCIGSWFYDVRRQYKTPKHVIEMLVDIVSKNGNLLLNIPQRPDGTIDEESTFLLEELADWFNVCSEGIYDTRPWKVSDEGKTKFKVRQFVEEDEQWTSSDFRFTKKGNIVYAFMLGEPLNGVSVLKSFTDREKVKNVRLLGYGNVQFNQSFGIITAKLPEKLPAKYVNCLAVELYK